MIKIKKEYPFIVAVSLYFISMAMDKINGPITTKLTTPYAFLQPKILSTFPFTGVSILLKVIALWISVLLILSLFEKKYLLKISIVLVTGTLAQLYSVQQLATGLRVTPLEWTLALAYTGIVLFPTALYYLLSALITSVSSRTQLPTHQPIKTLKSNTSLKKPQALQSPKSFEL